MKFRITLRIISSMLFLFSLFLLLTVFASLIFFKGDNSFYSFCITTCCTTALAIFFRYAGKQLDGDFITFREAIGSTVFGWVIFSFLAALPFYLSNATPSFVDALFESVSGLTTTGASIMTNIEAHEKSILLWRSVTHFIGGGGIILLTTLLLPSMGTGSAQLIKSEVSLSHFSNEFSSLLQTAKRIWFIYILLNVSCILLLIIGGMDVFEAVCHAFGAVATGGFSPLNESIGHYAIVNNPSAFYFEFILMIFMVLGSTPFILHYSLLTGQRKNLKEEQTFKFLTLLFAIAIISSLTLYYNNIYSSLSVSFRHGFFSVISVFTTTGYGTKDFSRWPVFIHVIFIVIMFIGGCTGSTAGGIKFIRVLISFKELKNSLLKALHPRKITSLLVNNFYLSHVEIKAVNTFILFFLVVFVGGVLILSIFENNLETIISAVVTCMSGVGPGTTTNIGPAGNFDFMHPVSKLTLSILMLLGRLEITIVLAVFMPRFWKK